MALRAMTAGYRLIVHSLSNHEADDLVAHGAVWAESPVDAAARCDVLITVLPGPREVREVMIGERGALAHMRPGSTYIDMSTSSVDVAAEVQARAQTCTGAGQDVTVTVVNTSLNWSAAKRAAARAGGYLAVIKSAEMASCVAGAVGDADVWLGASDSNGPGEGRWRWVDGTVFWVGNYPSGTAVDSAYSAWQEGEPNDYGRGEDCMVMNPGNVWNDMRCRAELPYVMMTDN